MWLDNFEMNEYMSWHSMWCCVDIGWKHDWVNPLGTTSRNGQETKIHQTIFLGLFLKNFIIINYVFLMFIYCMPKYMPWSFHYNHYKFVFFIRVAHSRIKFLNFENSLLNYNYPIKISNKILYKIPLKYYNH
jgi:hypothetical protein